MIHGKDFLHLNILLHVAIEADEEFKLVNMKEVGLAKEVRGEHPAKWKPSPKGKYKVNWDAVMDKANRRLGIGLVVSDYNGLVIAVRSLTKMENLKPVAVEALATFCVVEFSKELGLQNIILEGTCFLVVTALNFTG